MESYIEFCYQVDKYFELGRSEKLEGLKLLGFVLDECGLLGERIDEENFFKFVSITSYLLKDEVNLQSIAPALLKQLAVVVNAETLSGLLQASPMDITRGAVNDYKLLESELWTLRLVDY